MRASNSLLAKVMVTCNHSDKKILKNKKISHICMMPRHNLIRMDLMIGVKLENMTYAYIIIFISPSLQIVMNNDTETLSLTII